VRLWTYNQLPQYPRALKRLDFNDREAKDETYMECFAKKRRRLWLPIDFEGDPQFVAELCAEERLEDEHGRMTWNEDTPPNHYGDCVKLITIGLRFLTTRQAKGDA
jgi:hypothetical protein